MHAEKLKCVYKNSRVSRSQIDARAGEKRRAAGGACTAAAAGIARAVA
jgi:hypothetical protein